MGEAEPLRAILFYDLGHLEPDECQEKHGHNSDKLHFAVFDHCKSPVK